MTRVLVTGATGYVGGRLVPRLLKHGDSVRVLTRRIADRLEGRDWFDRVDVAIGDVLDPETLPTALEGIDVAYYLIHSMSDSAAYYERDLRAARNFGAAARKAGVERIIYLGGLGDPDADLSDHLRSRQETGNALRESGVPVTEFRAAIIVGSGSVSFEMIRHLTERLPIMICPRWVYTRVQPIAVRDVLTYLVAALDVPESAGRRIDIGGADVLTYGGMMQEYAAVRGLRRRLVPVPVLTPNLSAYWVHWVTPIPAGIARPLIEGLRNEVVVRSDAARQLFSEVEPLDYRTAVQLALDSIRDGDVETIWSDALASSQGDATPVVLTQEQGMIIERRQQHVRAPAETVYRTFSGLGGRRGWLYATWLWHSRGALDRLVGGVGLRRGRRGPGEVRVGDALDFWRVEAVETNRLLRLHAEMKLPGRGWLQFEARPHGEDETTLIQTAFFVPKGLFGLLYWYSLYPIHKLIFANLIRAVAEHAESSTLRPGETQKGDVPMGNRRLSVVPLVVALLAPQLAGAIGAIATAGSIDTWYEELEKPAWNPPGWIFAPVWTILYLMMGLASWQIWRLGSEKEEVRDALRLYGVHLGFNTLWSLIFFGRRRIGLALIEIVVLWGLIAATLKKFYRLKQSAGLLLVPYLLWTSFATVLNATIWRLNR